MRSQITVNTYVNQIPIKTNKRSDHIVIKHINAQILIPKLDEIKLLTENEDLYILFISETWLQPNILDDLISVKNYNVFRNDNPLNSRGSGACIYVKNIFTSKKYGNIEITDSEPSKGIEDVWVIIQANKFKLLLELCTNIQKQTQTALHIFRECYKPIVIAEKTCIC